MKSYTDIEQSKKLAKFLPTESADMGYLWNGTYFCEYPVSNQTIFKKVENIPCWSMVALLSILPEPSLIQNQEGSWMLRIYDNKRFLYSVGGYDNPIDACYEMIIKINKQKLL